MKMFLANPAVKALAQVYVSILPYLLTKKMIMIHDEEYSTVGRIARGALVHAFDLVISTRGPAPISEMAR